MNRGKTKKVSLCPGLGASLSILTFLKCPTKMRLLQSLNSVLLWKSGCKKEVCSM